MKKEAAEWMGKRSMQSFFSSFITQLSSVGSFHFSLARLLVLAGPLESGRTVVSLCFCAHIWKIDNFPLISQLVSFLIKSSLVHILSFTGHCRIHQERVWQEIQSNMALHRRTQLWLIRDTRDPSLYLLLLGSSSNSVVQERLNWMLCGRRDRRSNHPCLPRDTR